MRTLTGVISVTLSLTGCSVLPERWQRFGDDVQKEWSAFLIVVTGGRNPLAHRPATPRLNPVPSASPGAHPLSRNAQIIHEMIYVLWRRAPQSQAEFAMYYSSLEQGMSLEAIYNGMTHSSTYRRLEELESAKPQAVEAFAKELAVLESALNHPSEFTSASARPLPTPVAISLDPLPAAPPSSPISGTDSRPKEMQYRELFAHSSLYTLKRVLSTEAMAVLNQYKSDRKALASWYSRWVVEMAGRQVDFGLEQRNRIDAKFHSDWAMTASEDLLAWEVLNRLNRILNEASK